MAYSNRRILIPLAAAAIMAGFVILATYMRQPQGVPVQGALEQAITSYADRGLLDYDLPSFELGVSRVDLEYLRQSIELANRRYGTRIRNVVINPRQPDGDSLNLVFFRIDPDRVFTAIHNNCAYTGYKNIVICDLQFLRRITGLERPPQTGKTQEETEFLRVAGVYRSMVALWILGHEVGHIARGHTKRHYRFDEEPESVQILNFDGRPLEVENEADEFAFEVLAAHGGAAGIGPLLWIGLSAYVSEQARAVLMQQGINATDFDTNELQRQRYVIAAESRTHPPLFLRTVRLANRLATELQIDRTGYFEQILNQITVRSPSGAR